MSRRVPLSRAIGAALTHNGRQLATDLGGPARALNMRGGKPSLFHDIRPDYLPGNHLRGQSLLKGHFIHAGQILDIGQQGDPWTVPSPSERFATWLHGFHWLDDLLARDEKIARVRARFLVDRWITVYGKWNQFAWDPEILTHRLYQWLVHWSPTLQTDNLSDIAQARRSNVMRQLKRLRKIYKRTPDGAVRLKAAAVLVIGGARMQDNSDGFFARGLDWLDDQIDLQILSDGGHISRSPAQAFDVLRILQSVDGLLQARGLEGSRTISRGIDRLLPILPFFSATDGGLSCFHGGGEGDPKLIAKILKKAGLNTKPFGYCPHTHYQRIEQNGTVLLMDSGVTSPAPFDTEAHLSPLAIELSTDAGRLFVNCGWSPQQPAQWRRPMRATAAHSTLVLNGQSAGALQKLGARTQWLGEVVAQEAGPVRATRKEQVSGVWLEAAHEGYKPTTGLSHRRRIYMDVNGKDIRGEDSLYVPIGDSPKTRDEIPFDIRFHLHPDVRATLAQNLQSALLIQPGNVGWRFRTDGGPLAIETSIYLGKGSKPIKSEQLVISGRALGDSDGETRSNRVRWSVRRLETKS